MSIQPKTIEFYDWKEICEHLANVSESDEDKVWFFAYDAFKSELDCASGRVIVKLGFVNEEWYVFDERDCASPSVCYLGRWSKKILNCWNELYLELVRDKGESHPEINVLFVVP